MGKRWVRISISKRARDPIGMNRKFYPIKGSLNHWSLIHVLGFAEDHDSGLVPLGNFCDVNS